MFYGFRNDSVYESFRGQNHLRVAGIVFEFVPSMIHRWLTRTDPIVEMISARNILMRIALRMWWLLLRRWVLWRGESTRNHGIQSPVVRMREMGCSGRLVDPRVYFQPVLPLPGFAVVRIIRVSPSPFRVGSPSVTVDDAS